jgi:hypothetical protein
MMPDLTATRERERIQGRLRQYVRPRMERRRMALKRRSLQRRNPLTVGGIPSLVSQEQYGTICDATRNVLTDVGAPRSARPRGRRGRLRRWVCSPRSAEIRSGAGIEEDSPSTSQGGRRENPGGREKTTERPEKRRAPRAGLTVIHGRPCHANTFAAMKRPPDRSNARFGR